MFTSQSSASDLHQRDNDTKYLSSELSDYDEDDDIANICCAVSWVRCGT